MLPEDRLSQIVQRFEFLEAQLNAGAAPDQIARISREYAELKPVVEQIARWRGTIARWETEPETREGRRELAARAKPDGHTLAVATTAHAINATLFPRLAYDTLKDFAPVALLTESPLILVVNPALPAATVPELIALAKRKPGDLRYASSGNGQSTHLAAELFCAMAGVKMIHVPYRGSAPALQDVVSGQVELIFDTSQSALPHVGKTVRALGVTSTARLPVLPDTPTTAETLPGYEAIAWNGLMAPAGTPAGIVDRLNAAVLDVLAEPGVTGRFEALGATCRPTTPARFGAYVADEIAKWSKVVHESGAKVD